MRMPLRIHWVAFTVAFLSWDRPSAFSSNLVVNKYPASARLRRVGKRGGSSDFPEEPPLVPERVEVACLFAGFPVNLRAACGNRTHDLFITSESLCRLS